MVTKVATVSFCLLFVFWRNNPQWAMASSFTRFLDHTQRRTTFGRTPLDEWSARRRDLYLTTHNTQNRQTSMPPVGFGPTISAGEWPQTYASDHVTTGTGNRTLLPVKSGYFYSFQNDEIKLSVVISTDCFPCCECRKMIFFFLVRVKAHHRTICLSWLIFDNQKQQFKWIQTYTRLFHDKRRPTKQIKLKLRSTNDTLSWPLRHHYRRQWCGRMRRHPLVQTQGPPTKQLLFRDFIYLKWNLWCGTRLFFLLFALAVLYIHTHIHT